jgi:uncharacterized protein YjcR
MSKMDELAYEIEQLYIEGLSAKKIAFELGCDVKLVADWIRKHGLRPFSEWEESAQRRLIQDVFSVAENPQEDYSPFGTANS